MDGQGRSACRVFRFDEVHAMNAQSSQIILASGNQGTKKHARDGGVSETQSQRAKCQRGGRFCDSEGLDAPVPALRSP
jgi:hypothetical protein